MNSIGGYFELELRKGFHYHSNSIKLNTARNCFEYILRAKKYKKIYIPFYTCDVMLEPIHKLKIEYEFYSIDENLNPLFVKKTQPNEGFLYTNYFGLKMKTVEKMANRFGERLIIDNAQSFYVKPIKKIDTFYSPRKFFGVADGAYLYTDTILNESIQQDFSIDRISHLIMRLDLTTEEGYLAYQKNENDLICKPILRMSKFTDAVLRNVNYKKAKEIRRKNYLTLEEELGKKNLIHLNLEAEAIPMVYPFLSENEKLRDRLTNRKIYVAKYWPNIMHWCDSKSWEFYLTKNLFPLPIDHRYSNSEMQFIIKSILEYV